MATGLHAGESSPFEAAMSRNTVIERMLLPALDQGGYSTAFKEAANDSASAVMLLTSRSKNGHLSDIG